MSILNGLRKARFRDVEFLYEKSSVSFGRKTVSHEFLNTSKRYVEDLGELSRTFTMDVIIHSNNYNDYVNQKRRLESAIADVSGPGRLILPADNKDYNAVATVAKLSESITTINIAKYTLNFLVSDLNIFPQNTNTVTKSQITQSVENTQALIQDFFDNTFDVEENQFLRKVQLAREDLIIVTNAIESELSRIDGEVDQIGDTQSEITDFNNAVSSLLSTPSEISSRMNTIFNNFKLVTTDFTTLFEVSLNLIGLSNPDTVSSTNSERGKSIVQNSESTFNLSDVNVLAIAFQAAANNTYVTTDEVNETQQRLDENYFLITEDLDYDTLVGLQTLRDETNILLEGLKLNLANIITVRANSQPISAFAYTYYGSTTNDTVLLDLNVIEDPAFIAGDIKIISDI